MNLGLGNVFGSFPAANSNLLNFRDDAPGWYRQILEHSRPQFSHILSIADKNDGENINSLLRTVFETVVDRYYVKFGYFRMRTQTDFGEQCTVLIHSRMFTFC